MALTLALALGSAHAATYALVVGNNTARPGSGYSPLAYADDDALRMAELLGALGAQVTLLAQTDADTAPRLSDSTASAPTRAALLAALEHLATVAGPGDDVWFYFSGHGSMNGASAYLHLADGRFTRADLHARLLRPLKNVGRLHVIIDSCHAWFLVNARGARVAVAQDLERFDQYPRAGFLLSTSRRKAVHEWAGYRGGVFTHQLLGALRGAADVNTDATVTYGETHAYLVAANLGITDARARIEPYVRHPAVGPPTLVALHATPKLRLAQLAANLGGRLYIDDARGERLLDAHKAAGQPLQVLLPPDQQVALHLGARTYTLQDDGRFTPEPLHANAEVASRGLLSDQFREHLFARPLTADFVTGFEAGLGLEALSAAPAPRPWTQDPLTLGLLSGAGAALITAGVLTPLYLDARDAANARPITADTEDARDRATRLQVGMAAAWGVGATLLATTLLRITFSE